METGILDGDTHSARLWGLHARRAASITTAITCSPHHDGGRVRLISRRGLDWSDRFPAIVAAVNTLAVHSCIVDGELIACDANGLADFQLLRRRKRDDPAVLCVFDLIEI